MVGMSLPNGGYKESTVSKFDDNLKRDFKNFLFYIWKHLGLPDPTPMQYDIADYLQYGPKRRIIQALRGEGKSWITSAYVIWLLFNDPQEKILVISASKIRSDDFSTFTKRLIHEIPILAHLQASASQRDSNISFDVGPARPAHAPSVKSVGITGQMTGSRADTIVADDVEVPNNSMTQVMRDKLSETVKEFDAVLSPGGQIVYLGTPQSEMTLYSELEERGYVARLWPAIYPAISAIPRLYKSIERLSPILYENLKTGKVKAGDAVDPDRFTLLDLAERKASYGNSGFALQFLLDTTLSDRMKYPLSLKDLIVMECDPKVGPTNLIWTNSPTKRRDDLPSIGLSGDYYYGPMMIPDNKESWDKYQVIVMSIDPSGRGKDETGYAIIGYLHGFLHVLDAGGYIGGYDDATLSNLASKAKKYNVNEVVVEDTWGDGMFSKLFTPILHKYHSCSIIGEKSYVQKEKRIIDTLEPLMNQHRLVVNSELIHKDIGDDNDDLNDRQYQLFYQMTRLTHDKGSLAHDDRLDALEMAVAYFTNLMDNDAVKSADGAKREMLEQQLKDWTQEMYGNTPGLTNDQPSVFN
jgi:hypothetical protein